MPLYLTIYPFIRSVLLSSVYTKHFSVFSLARNASILLVPGRKVCIGGTAMSSKSSVSTAASRWIRRFPLILNVSVEPGRVIGSVPDDLIASVGQAYPVLPLHGVSIAAFLLFVVVTADSISHRVVEIVRCGLRSTEM